MMREREGIPKFIGEAIVFYLTRQEEHCVRDSIQDVLYIFYLFGKKRYYIHSGRKHVTLIVCYQKIFVAPP